MQVLCCERGTGLRGPRHAGGGRAGGRDGGACGRTSVVVVVGLCKCESPGLANRRRTPSTFNPSGGVPSYLPPTWGEPNGRVICPGWILTRSPFPAPRTPPPAGQGEAAWKRRQARGHRAVGGHRVRHWWVEMCGLRGVCIRHKSATWPLCCRWAPRATSVGGCWCGSSLLCLEGMRVVVTSAMATVLVVGAECDIGGPPCWWWAPSAT